MPSFARRRHGFSLIELLLVLGVVAVLLVAMFVVYPAVRTEIRVGKEISYITGAVAKFQTQFPNNRYNGVQAVWQKAREDQEPWAVSPNGWTDSWGIQEAQKVGNLAQSCSSGRCTHIWIQLYYRDSGINEAECLKILSVLSSRFEMPGFTNPGPTTFINQCNKSGGPVFISFLTQ